MAEKKYTFLIYAPDYTDPDHLARRLAVRPKHLVGGKALKDQAILRLGGALVSPDTLDSPNKNMIGSMMVYEAESIDVVRQLIHNDPYYTEGVWDKEKLVIVPWVSAFPLPVVPE